MEKFSCDRCTAVCCIIPPQITIEEVEQARNLDVEVIGVLREDKVSLHIKQSNKHTCPFLEDSNNCAIYDDRFESCRQFSCRALETSMQIMANVGNSNRFNKMSSDTSGYMPPSYTTEEVKNLGVEIMDEEVARLYLSGHSAMELTHRIGRCDYEYSET